MCKHKSSEEHSSQQENLIVERKEEALLLVFTFNVYRRADGMKQACQCTPEFTKLTQCESSKDVQRNSTKNNHFCTLARELQAKSIAIKDSGHFVQHKLLSWEDLLSSQIVSTWLS